MIQVVNSHVAKQDRKEQSSKSGSMQWLTTLMSGHVEQIEDRPQAYFVELFPEATITPHFHQVDQFQVFVAGSGTIGRNAVPIISVHYADHHTAYGPINAGRLGLSYFALRSKSDPGGIRPDKPGYREFLKPTKKRYLLKEHIELSIEPALRKRSEVTLETVIDGQDYDDGLGAYMLRLGADMKATGPDPQAAGGQYYVVVNGSLKLDEASYPVWSTIYAGPTDAPLEIRAAHDGLEMLVLTFPRFES